MLLFCVNSLLRGPCAYKVRTEALAVWGHYSETSLRQDTRCDRAAVLSSRRYASTEESSKSHLTDLRHPALWYPVARALRRTIICHLGPTNSGKTHSALEALKTAHTGLYCGPLRLLACEVADRLNAGGLPCDLLTGQEQRTIRGARHAACTVEMAAVGADAAAKTYDVAVIDEIQMLGDRNRGWAWSRALLGLRALTIHVCGDPGALPLLEQLARDCGDVLQVHHYQRLSPLIVSGRALGCLSQVQPGDALVAFSRRAVYGLQREVLRRAPWATPSLVYGALPPDARRHQASAFNNGDTGCHVLVASDAIGMGLNLAIQRVIFTAMTKYDGKEVRPLTPSEVRQIAGRAGRFRVPGRNAHGKKQAADKRKSQQQQHHIHTAAAGIGNDLHRNDAASVTRHVHTSAAGHSAGQNESYASNLPVPVQAGYVTCLHEHDLDVLHAALQEPPSVITQACLLPRIEDIALFYTELNKIQETMATEQANGTDKVATTHLNLNRGKASHRHRQPGHSRQLATPLDQVLVQYMKEAKLSTHHMLADMTPVLRIAQLLSGAVSDELSITELLTFCMAPADVSNAGVAAALLRYVALYIEDGSVPVSAARVSIADDHIPTTEEQLKHLEECHAVLDMYVWLAYRMPAAFRDLLRAQEIRNSLATRITHGLEHLARFRHEGHAYHHTHDHGEENHSSRARKQRRMKEYEMEGKKNAQQQQQEAKNARSDPGRRSRNDQHAKERRGAKARKHDDVQHPKDYQDTAMDADGTSSREQHVHHHRSSHTQHGDSQEQHVQVDEFIDRSTGTVRNLHAQPQHEQPAQHAMHQTGPASHKHGREIPAAGPGNLQYTHGDLSCTDGNYHASQQDSMDDDHAADQQMIADHDAHATSKVEAHKRLPARIRKKLSLKGY